MLLPTLTLWLAGATLQAQLPAQATREIVRAVSGGRGDSVAASLRRQSAPNDTLAVVRLAALARLRYRYAEAADHLTTILREGDDPRSPVQFEALLEWSRLNEDQSRPVAADSAATRAIRLAAAWGRPDLEAQALLQRSTEQTDRFLVPRAIAGLERAMSLAPDDPWLQAEARCALVDQYVLVGRFQEAAAAASRDAERAAAAGHLRAAALCRFVHARIQLPRGRFDSATAILAEVAERSRAAGDLGLVARAQYLRAHLLGFSGEYGEARRAARESLTESLRTKNTYFGMRSALSLARSSLSFGDLPSARHYASIADSMLAILPDPIVATTLRAAQGSMARAVGDLETAEARYREALADAAELGPPFPAYQHRSLAAVAREGGNPAGAAALLDSARANAALANMGSWITDLRYDEAGVLLDQGRPAAAERTLRRLLAELDATAYSRRFPAAARLSRSRLLQGDTAGAEAVLRAASDSFDLWRATLENQRLRTHVYELREGDLIPDRDVPMVLAGLVAGGHVTGAFEIAEKRRARELVEQSIMTLAIQPQTNRERTPVATAETLGSWRDLANAIPDRATAIVEFVATPGTAHSIAFIVTRDSVTATLLPAVDSLTPAIDRLTALVLEGADPSAPAGHLGDALMKPILAGLPPEVTRLVIVPDGALHRVAFDALTVKGRSLLEDWEMSLAPSAEIIARTWRATPAGGPVRILAVGDPTLPRASTAVAYGGGPRLVRLPGSARETRQVARYADSTVVWLRNTASEDRLKAASLSAFRILHFATHAIVDETVAERTALVLAAGGDDDGYLHPGELGDLELAADLVVLSACRTAGGVILRGEGVQGLTTPFLRAGARSVVATRWPVGDHATPRLVQAFYDRLAAGSSVGNALRGAKLEQLARGAPAREWAGFVLTGDPLAVVPLTLPAPPGRWPIALAVVVLAALGYWAWRSRKGLSAEVA